MCAKSLNVWVCLCAQRVCKEIVFPVFRERTWLACNKTWPLSPSDTFGMNCEHHLWVRPYHLMDALVAEWEQVSTWHDMFHNHMWVQGVAFHLKNPANQIQQKKQKNKKQKRSSALLQVKLTSVYEIICCCNFNKAITLQEKGLNLRHQQWKCSDNRFCLTLLLYFLQFSLHVHILSFNVTTSQSFTGTFG